MEVEDSIADKYAFVFLAQKKDPRSVSTAEQDKSGIVLSLSRVMLGVEGKQGFVLLVFSFCGYRSPAAMLAHARTLLPYLSGRRPTFTRHAASALEDATSGRFSPRFSPDNRCHSVRSGLQAIPGIDEVANPDLLMFEVSPLCRPPEIRRFLAI